MKTILVLTNENDATYIKKEKGEPIGRLWRIKGRDVYLAKRVDGHLVSFDPKAESLKRKHELVKGSKRVYSPQELYDAIDWKLAEDVYVVRNTALEKLNVGLMIALTGILCFFIYLILANLGGW